MIERFSRDQVAQIIQRTEPSFPSPDEIQGWFEADRVPLCHPLAMQTLSFMDLIKIRIYRVLVRQQVHVMQIRSLMELVSHRLAAHLRDGLPGSLYLVSDGLTHHIQSYLPRSYRLALFIDLRSIIAEILSAIQIQIRKEHRHAGTVRLCSKVK